MHEHDRTQRVHLFLIVLLLSWPARAIAQNAVEANGPANLETSSGPLFPPLPFLTPALPNGTRAADPPPTSDFEAATPAMKPALQERQPLGSPATPPKSKEPQEGSDSIASAGLLQKFDPRSNEITKVAGALAAVIGLLFMARAVMRRAGGLMAAGGRPSGVLEILAKYPVGRGQSLILLKVARRVVLLHQSGSSMSALSELTDQNEVAALLARMESGANQRDAARFRKTLDEFAAMYGDASNDKTSGSRKSLPLGDAELVDLTRKHRKPLAWIFQRKARA